MSTFVESIVLFSNLELWIYTLSNANSVGTPFFTILCKSYVYHNRLCISIIIPAITFFLKSCQYFHRFLGLESRDHGLSLHFNTTPENCEYSIIVSQIDALRKLKFNFSYLTGTCQVHSSLVSMFLASFISLQFLKAPFLKQARQLRPFSMN